ncbi:MAG: TerD family protein [Victivallales bacterium]|nr:TerD family protein [Victivallales bacterium]
MSTPSADEFISLGKDAGLDLQKSDGLSQISVILGWDTESYEGDFDFDLDAEAFLLNKNNRVRNNQDLVFYKNLEHVSGAVVHQGDNSVLKGDADGEIINVDLDRVPKNIEKIVFTVTIDDAEFREQNFGMVSNTYISIIDTATGKELVNCQLAENFGDATALVVGEIVRHQGIWKFRPLRRGSQKTLFDLCVDYGVNVK